MCYCKVYTILWSQGYVCVVDPQIFWLLKNMSKLYSLNNEYIDECHGVVPENFTGINILRNGSKFWRLNGQRHRVDGPAVELPPSDNPIFRNLYYLNNKLILGATPESFKLLVDIMRLKGLL